MSLSQWYTWQVCVPLQWVQKHTHTHIPPRNVGYIRMHMYREHAKCNRTQTHAHMENTAQTSTHPCRHAPGSMHTHTPGITWQLHAHKIVPTTQKAPFLCRDTDTDTRILGERATHPCTQTHKCTHTPGNTHHAYIHTDTPQETHSTNTHRSRHRHTLLHREHHRNMYTHTLQGTQCPESYPCADTTKTFN